MRCTGAGAVLLALLGAGTLVGCEDGPRQIFNPNLGDQNVQNGNAPSDAFVQQGGTAWTDTAGSGDSAGRAKFCDESETTSLLQWMVQQPVLPDGSVGGIPLWRQDGSPASIDDLQGRPEDGKFCQPFGSFIEAPYGVAWWGDQFEVVVVYDAETRLIVQAAAYPGYRGTLAGTYSEGGQSRNVELALFRRLQVGGVTLDEYASSAQQASKIRAWTNHHNVTRIYSMLLETFFGQPPLPDDYNCVVDKYCDIIYSGEDESVAQGTYLSFGQIGVGLSVAPDGTLDRIYLEPVRVAPFETEGNLRFSDETGRLSPRFASTFTPACVIDVLPQDGSPLTFQEFFDTCVGNERMLGRFGYDVHAQRDAVDVSMSGMTLGFLRRDTTVSPVMQDGERPAPGDELHSLQIVRSLNAPLAEFNAQALGAIYKSKLEARIHAAVDSDYPGHPFSAFELALPALSAQAQRVGEIDFAGPNGQKLSWLNDVVEQVRAQYDALDAAERAAVSPAVISELFLVEPFVDAVLSALSHGATDDPVRSYKLFSTTDSLKWSIGYGHFQSGEYKVRINVQYSLYFGAVTSIGVSVGGSDVDAVLDMQSDVLRAQAGLSEGYFTAEMLGVQGGANPLGLSGLGIKLKDFDRGLGMHAAEVTVAKRQVGGGIEFVTTPMALPGTHLRDRAGYLRQLRGERYEFVPAHSVGLYGKETRMLLYVLEQPGEDENGNAVTHYPVGRVVLPDFKGQVQLCPGLSIAFGDDVRQALKAWRSVVGLSDYQACEVVFNYSDNGNVLDEVVSLSNRISISTVGGRATTVATWL